MSIRYQHWIVSKYIQIILLVNIGINNIWATSTSTKSVSVSINMYTLGKRSEEKSDYHSNNYKSETEKSCDEVYLKECQNIEIKI